MWQQFVEQSLHRACNFLLKVEIVLVNRVNSLPFQAGLPSSDFVLSMRNMPHQQGIHRCISTDALFRDVCQGSFDNGMYKVALYRRFACGI